MGNHAALTSRARKIKALLAGGVVLSLGAAATLAAWTDDVWVSGSFAAGQFNVQGAVVPNGDWTVPAWEELANLGDAGALSFTVVPSQLTPGDSVYAPLYLRMGPEKSEYDAAISLPNAPNGPAVISESNTALFSALDLSLYNVPPANCNHGGTDEAPIGGFSDVELGTTSTGTLLTLDRGMTPQGVCFKVTLPANAPTDVQGGQTGDLTWNFHAESVDTTP